MLEKFNLGFSKKAEGSHTDPKARSFSFNEGEFRAQLKKEKRGDKEIEMMVEQQRKKIEMANARVQSAEEEDAHAKAIASLEKDFEAAFKDRDEDIAA